MKDFLFMENFLIARKTRLKKFPQIDKSKKKYGLFIIDTKIVHNIMLSKLIKIKKYCAMCNKVIFTKGTFKLFFYDSSFY